MNKYECMYILSACGGFFFSRISVARGALLHLFFQNTPSPPKKNNAPLAKPLSACKYKTTFTSTTKIVLRFNNADNDFFSIARRVRYTHLPPRQADMPQRVITPEAVDKLKDELGGIFTNRDKSTAIWRVQSPRASAGSSLATPPGTTRYKPIQEHTLPMP
jgi:hypothetical protein